MNGSRLRRILLCSGLVVCLFLIVTCSVETSRQFSFENASGATVTVRVNDRLRLQLAPGETKSFNTPNNKGQRHVLAIDEHGAVRLDENFTWEELERRSFSIVIR